MTLQKVEAGALEKVARPRPMPRSMRDYDMDDEYTQALIDMLRLPTRPCISGLTSPGWPA